MVWNVSIATSSRRCKAFYSRYLRILPLAAAFGLVPLRANEVKNGDFGKGSSGWITGGYGRPRPCETTEDPIGNRCLVLDMTKGPSGVFQELQVPKKFSTCVLTFRAKVLQGSKDPQIRASFESFDRESSFAIVRLTPDGQWKPYSVQLNADSLQRRVRLLLTPSNVQGVVFIDDVVLTDIAEKK